MGSEMCNKRQAGDHVALTEVFDRLAPMVYGGALRVLGHHAAGSAIRLATPIKMLPREIDRVSASNRFQNPQPFGNNFASDAVPFNHRDPVAIHSTPLSLSLLGHSLDCAKSDDEIQSLAGYCLVLEVRELKTSKLPSGQAVNCR